ncbi:unnamed protein product [Adineta steineri]|uniref:Homeobox domain-containing protein n=2 Tax=Adineta steineri TaxID=433720 RepID=A0A820JLV8_9BILA|nr:unnamed protein product [Adineta steineri]CAF4328392.1 unnamed protein product [Adineta steineri]
MSYPLDSSYGYSSGDDSFSYISDSYYCPVHNPVPQPPSVGYCTFQLPYPYYYPVTIPQQQVRPEKTRRFSPEQFQILEEYFYKVDKYVSKTTIDDLSTRTQLTPAQIRVWFNNKRTRERQNN